MNHFSYHSEQVHSTFQGGRGETRRNIVSIKNGKGYKAVETYTADGKLKKKAQKDLTASELGCIQRNKFIPGLFKDCIKPMRPNGKTRRRRAH